MPLILPGNVASATASTGFNVDNSCRFNKADSAHMQKTLGSGNTDVFTISMWVKRGVLGEHHLFRSYAASDDFCCARFEGSDVLKFYQTAGTTFNLTTTQVFRDTGAWYHIMYSVDTGQVTAGNRIKLYVNGTQVTSFSTETQPDQNDDVAINTTSHVLYVGSDQVPSTYFDGYMAEVVFLDGTAAANTDLGEFDSDSPTIWKPVDPSGLTFGTSGFYLDFKDSANLGNDANGGTDLAETNLAATDQTTDTPTNNFCTLNPLSTTSYTTLSEGNTLAFGNTSTNLGIGYGTIAPNGGKWYMEIKVTTGSSVNYPRIAMQQVDELPYGTVVIGGVEPGIASAGSGWYSQNNMKYTNATLTNPWVSSAWVTGDIISMAFDCDNGAAYVGLNDTWEDSGDPSSGASKTGAFCTWTPGDRSGIAPCTMNYNGSYSSWNFGNPAYANSSDAADGNGYGAFEYAPPSGYLALCTKNLGSDGG
jgi:hypothetical protein